MGTFLFHTERGRNSFFRSKLSDCSLSDMLKFPSNICAKYEKIVSEKKSPTASIEPRSPGNENFMKRVLYLFTRWPRQLILSRGILFLI